jgi:large subunit ribosomal protein L18
MNKLTLKTNKAKRKLRVRKKVFGTADRPRLSVFRSNKFVYGQIVDDEKGITLIDIQGDVAKISLGKSKIDASFEIGKALAEKAKEKKITNIVFDRGSYKYHGRVKKFAEGVREGGLQF